MTAGGELVRWYAGKNTLGTVVSKSWVFADRFFRIEITTADFRMTQFNDRFFTTVMNIYKKGRAGFTS